MDKIEQIHVGRVPYSIEVGAHTLLKDYLKDIRANLDSDTADEVIGDIESRIPELLLERKVKPKDVITKKDVLAVRKQLGEPEQFSNDEPVTPTGVSTKRLFRDPDGELIAGVASGIGKYLNLDANLVRAVFFVSVFFGGFGIVLYLFLWLLLPVAKSSSDKLMMSGMPVTVASLQRYQTTVQRGLKDGPRIARTVLEAIGRAIVICIYLCIVTALLVALGLFSGLIFVDPFRSIISSYHLDYVIIGLLWILALSFVGLFTMLVLKVSGRRMSKFKVSSLLLAAVFIAALAGLGTTGVMAASHFSNEYSNGKVNTSLTVANSSPSTVPTTLDVKADQYMEISYVVTSDPIHASYEALPGLLRPSISVTNSGGVLAVDSSNLNKAAPICLGGLCRRIYLPIHVTVYGPAVKQITSTNGADLTITNATIGTPLSLVASNGSSINLNDSYVPNLTIDASNGASISANNTTSTDTAVTVDSTSQVTAPSTNTLTVTVPTNCNQYGNPVLFLNGYSGVTTVNGQIESLNQLQSNSCIQI